MERKTEKTRVGNGDGEERGPEAPATAGREASATKSGERWEHEVNATPKLSDGEHTQRTFGVGQAFGRGLGALALTLGVDELDFGQADDAEDGA